MTTAYQGRGRPRRGRCTVTRPPHGPGSPGTLRPGERGSVMILSPAADPDTALRDAMSWITAFEDDCGLVLDHDETSLYAIATAHQVRGGLDRRGRSPDEEETLSPAHFLDAILQDGRWRQRGAAGLGSPGAWEDLYEHVLRSAAPTTLCTVWDVYPLPAAA